MWIIKTKQRGNPELGFFVVTMRRIKRMVSYKAVRKHYEIYVNDIFVCSCDAGELTETLKEYGYYSC